MNIEHDREISQTEDENSDKFRNTFCFFPQLNLEHITEWVSLVPNDFTMLL